MNQLQVSKTKTILLGGNTYSKTHIVIILIVPYIFLCNGNSIAKGIDL